MLTVGTQYNIGRCCWGDKSITHRALILASIASGTVIITNASTCCDCMSTLHCLEQLGASFDIDGTTIIVQPIVTANSGVILDCGNSGTTARLLAGLIAGLGVDATLVGDSSLTARPMGRVIDPLVAMGASISTADNIIMRIHAGHKLHGITYHTPIASAQVKSALLIASLYAEGITNIVEDIATRDHTERLLQYMGVDYTGSGNKVPQSCNIDIPNDMSTAIYGIVLALYGEGVVLDNIGINEGRIGAINALIASGASISLDNRRLVCGEWRADIAIQPSIVAPLYMSSADTVSAVDDILPLTVVASTINGTSVICGVGELAHKESNRLTAIIDLAEQMGASAVVDDNNLTIIGNTHSSRHITVDSIDHRVAMTAVIGGLINHGATLCNYKCIDISCPQFLGWLGINITRLALVGGNVQGSLSGLICSIHSRASNINCSYDLISLEDATDSQLLDIATSYHGINVTMPYKQRMAQLLDSPLDSVNTVCGAVTASTDGVGMIDSLSRHNIDINNANILVIGAGGASLSVVKALLDSHANIYVVNRTQSKADIINNMYGLLPLEDYNGIISCVPPCSYETYAAANINAQWVASVSYRTNSMLCDWATKQGIPYIGGLAMLYYQARASFNIWCNTDVEDCFDQLEKLL